ncbi:Ppx/GppA phosphatase family protein [Pseudoclavibacter sp. 13-3]|uniref:Ppx/GppA phosphatase family protein n=1 Tax=Pseudoclavibacter sp. 13-3 TaxID=2901228 RepID=UPI001E37DF3C|nr:exopolyphosphatase [Pseudoclavibacter sp. 13-3]MCD7100681.1 exopolyphosphatase [Pseudoclavibacter sp. 13-3]
MTVRDRVAAIDCGTNTVRLLVLDGPDPTRQLARRTTTVRLGEGVDRTHAFAPAGLDRLAVALHDYQNELTRLGVAPDRLRFVATSASRDVHDSTPLRDVVESILGVRPEIISGVEEADLSYAGALTGLPSQPTTLVVDLGGGSTELVVGRDGRPLAAWSMNVGGVRLTERHLDARRPMTAAQHASIVADVDQALDEAETRVSLAGVERVIGVSDSVGMIAAVAAGVRAERFGELSGGCWSLDALQAACARLVAADSQALTEFGVDDTRTDVIAAAAVIWSRVSARIAARTHCDQAVYSEHDILDGAARALLAGGRDRR